MKNIKRSIYFYNLNILKYNKETNTSELSTNLKIDFDCIINELKVLMFDKENLEYSVYLKKTNGTYDLVKILQEDTDYIFGQLINIDENGLKYYEMNGKLIPLEENNVAEIAHFYIDLKTNIMAFEYNAKCSHAASLANYLTVKNKSNYMVMITNLQSKETLNRLNKIQKVVKFEFESSSKLLKINQSASDNKLFKALGATYDLASNNTDSSEQIITLKMKNKVLSKKEKKEGISPFFSSEQIKSDLKDITNLTEEEKFKLDIVGYDEFNEKIRVNYFRDLIISSISINSGDYTVETVFAKMKECYQKTYQEYIK